MSELVTVGCCIDIYNVDRPAEAVSELPEELIVRKDWSEGNPNADSSRSGVQATE